MLKGELFRGPPQSFNLRSSFMNARLFLVPLAFAAVTIVPVQALILDYTEDFTSGTSGWLNGSSAAPAWSSTGGVDGGAYISVPGAITAGGFGTTVFRAPASASDSAFSGDFGGLICIPNGDGGFQCLDRSWSTYLSHDAPTSLNISVRFDAGSGDVASTVDFSVPSGTWFKLEVPIEDSPASFQSYGEGTFETVFDGIQNVEIVLSATQDPSTVGQTYHVSLDRVATVPEPGTLGLVASGLAASFLVRRRWLRRNPLLKS